MAQENVRKAALAWLSGSEPVFDIEIPQNV